MPAPFAANTGYLARRENCTSGYPANPDSIDAGIFILNTTTIRKQPCGNRVDGGCTQLFQSQATRVPDTKAAIYICGPTGQFVPCGDAAAAASYVRSTCVTGCYNCILRGPRYTRPNPHVRLYSGTYFVDPHSSTGRDLYIFVTAKNLPTILDSEERASFIVT